MHFGRYHVYAIPLMGGWDLRCITYTPLRPYITTPDWMGDEQVHWCLMRCARIYICPPVRPVKVRSYDGTRNGPRIFGLCRIYVCALNFERGAAMMRLASRRARNHRAIDFH